MEIITVCALVQIKLSDPTELHPSMPNMLDGLLPIAVPAGSFSQSDNAQCMITP